MSGNANFRADGTSSASKDKQWSAFDQLPRTIREALAEAAFDWAAYPILRWWNSGRYKTAKDLAKRIKQWDSDQIKKDRKRVWKM